MKGILSLFFSILISFSSMAATAITYTQHDLEDGLTYLNNIEKKLVKKLNYRYLETSLVELQSIQKMAHTCISAEDKKSLSLSEILNQKDNSISISTLHDLEINHFQTQKRLELCQKLSEKAKKLIILNQEQQIEAKDYKESGNHRISITEVIHTAHFWNGPVYWKNARDIFANEIFEIKQAAGIYIFLIVFGLIAGILVNKYFKKRGLESISILLISSISFFYVFLKIQTNHFLIQPKLNWVLENIIIYSVLHIFASFSIQNFYQQASEKVQLHLKHLMLLFLTSLLAFSLINFMFIDAMHHSITEEFYYFIYILVSGIYFPILCVYLILEFSQTRFFKPQALKKINMFRYISISMCLGYFFLRSLIIFMGYQWFTTLQLVFVLFLIFYSIIFIQYLSRFETSLQLGKTRLAKALHTYFDVPMGKDIYELSGIKYIIQISILYSLFMVILDILSFPPYYIAIIQRLVWEGFYIGAAHIIPINFIYALIILISGSMLGKYISYMLLKRNNKSFNLDRKMTLILVIKYLSISISLLMSLLVLGVSSAELSVIIGGIGVGLGMGLRDLVMDFIAGMLILVQKTIHIGDYISMDNQVYAGQVLKIMPLSMQILLEDHTSMYIPNSFILKYSFTNHSCSQDIHTGFFLFKIKNVEDFNEIQTLIFEYLSKNKQVIIHGPYAAQLNFLNMKDNTNNHNILHLTFNLRKHAEKNIVIAKIKAELNHLLKNYLAN